MANMKRLTSLLLVLVMVFSLSTSAFAASITVTDDSGLTGHTYTAYQILTGTQETSEGTLGDAAWGSGIDSAAFLTALKNDAVVGADFADCDSALEFAAIAGTYATGSAQAQAVAKAAYECKTGSGTALAGTTELESGYYLIVDTTDVTGTDDVNNAALLQITDHITIGAKNDKPSVEKRVEENVKYDQDGGYGTGYNDVADYSIGDSVSFAFYSAVPDMTYYDTYKYILHDVMSAGLTLVEDSIQVTIGETVLVSGTDYTVSTACTDGCTFEIIFSDLKAVAAAQTGAEIRVDFEATLNSNAVIGLDGNPNTVMLEYSNNPNESGAGDTDNTGKTEWDEVIVFTYQLDTTKVDGEASDTKLKDAEFVLYRGTDSKEYVIVDAEGKVTGWTTDQDAASTLTSDENGLFKVIGLDDGTYYLEETKAPAGYNILTAPVTVIITAATANGQEWNDHTASTALTQIDVTADGEAGVGSAEDGTAAITIGNNKGATLPETGGMGTTIFYTLGGILVLGAAVLLITRKRMSAEA